MKIYTRSGDDGTSGLFGGRRVAKCDPRLECYGTLDELSAFIGLTVCAADASFTMPLRAVQNDLLALGAHLATPPESAATGRLPALNEEMVTRLETQIDAAEAELPKLRQFLLPGGTEAGARLHAARAVCRRAERLAVWLASETAVPPLVLSYLNRLSDWLFVMARLANHRAGVGDVLWQKPAEKGE